MEHTTTTHEQIPQIHGQGAPELNPTNPKPLPTQSPPSSHQVPLHYNIPTTPESILHVNIGDLSASASELFNLLYKQLSTIQAQQQAFFLEISKRFEDLDHRQINVERLLASFYPPFENSIPSTPAGGSSSTTTTTTTTTSSSTPVVVSGRKRASAANLASNMGALVPSSPMGTLTLSRTITPYKRMKGLVDWMPRTHIKTFWRAVIFPQTRNPKEDELLESLANTFNFPKNGDTIQVARSKGLGTIRKCRHSQNLQALNICSSNRYMFANIGTPFTPENYGEDDSTRGPNIVKRKVEHSLRLSSQVTPLMMNDHVALWERASNNVVNESQLHRNFSTLLLEIWEEYRQEIKLLDQVKHHTDRAAVKQKYFDYLLSPDVDSQTHACASWLKWTRPEVDVDVDVVDEIDESNSMNSVPPPPQVEEENNSQQTTQPTLVS